MSAPQPWRPARGFFLNCAAGDRIPPHQGDPLPMNESAPTPGRLPAGPPVTRGQAVNTRRLAMLADWLHPASSLVAAILVIAIGAGRHVPAGAAQGSRAQVSCW